MLFGDEALARRLELNGVLGSVENVQSLKLLGLHQACFEPVAGGYAIYAGKDMPGNRAGGLGLRGPVAPEELDKLENFYAGVGWSAQIEICPYADLTLMKLLGERGYRITGGFFNQHFRTLSPADAQPEPVAGVRIVRAEKGTQAGQNWVKVVAGAFGEQAEAEQNPANLIPFTSTLNRKSVSCFLATVDGELAGGGAMAVRDGLASLFSTATMPKFRGKGVQKALIQARLAAAQAASCDLAAVTTVPGNNSQRNLERLGFRVAYSKIILYLKSRVKFNP